MPARSCALLALLVLGCDGAAPWRPVEEDVFIALTRDFEGFEAWTAFDRSEAPFPPLHLGHRSMIYVSALPPAGATAFPIGTRVVRVEEDGEDSGAWEIHAMAKRGGRFNADGAAGWEYFGLHLDTAHHTTIAWRGIGPSGSGNGYTLDDGGVLFSCNHCHALETENDGILTPVLDLHDPTR